MRYGPRVEDIRDLKLGDFDWEKSVISYVQRKNNKRITLKLYDDVATAFIDNETARGKTFMKCAPLLFRILYATGLRINEALSLRIGDISFENRCLIVLESKNNDSRLVPVSQSLLQRIEKYLSALDYDEKFPLFSSSSGNYVSDSCAYEWYRWILWRAGIPHHGRGKGPRLHDLRHTFAVHSLQSATEKGMDPNAFIPLLSVYLGHKSISATERYLRLTAEVYPYLTAEMDRIMNHIIPEVTDYEE